MPQNTYRPNQIASQKAPPETVRAADGQDAASKADVNSANEHDPLADSYKLGYLGQLYDYVVFEGSQTNYDPNFRPGDHIPEGYEAYASAFAKANSVQDITLIRTQIDENLDIRKRRETRGTGSTIAADIVTGIFDPLNLIPGGIVAKGGRMGVVEGAVRIGAPGAAASITAATIDPTATREEGAAGAGGSLLLGGVIGGIVGRSTGRSAAPVAKAATAGLGRTEGVAKPMTLAYPVDGPIGSRFGPRPRPRTKMGYGSAMHGGVDFKVGTGTPVRAGGTGVVTDVTTIQNGKGNGISVTVSYGKGVETRVLHLSQSKVKVGDRVMKGQVYALSGNTGNSSGPHLHYIVRINGVAVDPLRANVMVDGGVGYRALGDVAEVGPDFKATPVPAAVIDTVNLFQNLEPPSRIEIDGRGVPVYVGPTDTGAMASFVRGRTAAEMAEGEVARFEVQNRMADAPDAPRNLVTSSTDLPPSRYDGLQVMPLNEAKAVARKFAIEDGAIGEKAITKRAGEVMDEMRAAIHGDPVKRVAAAEGLAPDDPRARARLAARYRARAEAAALADAPDHVVEALEKAADDLTDGIDTALTQEADDLYGARAAYKQAVDADLAEMNAELPRSDPYQTRDQMRDAMRKGDKIDDLPFGMKHNTDGGAFRDGDHLQIDAAEIIASFSEKPWTQPHMDGVFPFAVNEFKTPDEWLNFVVNHELEHVVNPRREGEALADYENRINQRALKQLRAGQEHFSPSTNRLEALAIAPTPMGQLQRLITDSAASVHQSIQDLAGDFGAMMARNKVGGPSTPGGSVFQRTLRWRARQVEIADAVRRQYLELVGVGEKGNRVAVEGSLALQQLPFVGAKARGHISLDQFRSEVTRAIAGFSDVSPQASRAAEVYNTVMKDIEKQARELGLFQSTKGLNARAEQLEARAAAMEPRATRLLESDPETAKDMEETIARWRDEAADYREQASKTVMPFREDNYFTRIWDVDALQANEAGILDILRRGYARVGHPDPDAAARGAFETITLTPDGDFSAPGTVGSLKHRSIPVTNKEVFDFIIQDVEVVSSIYLHRMGAMLEMTRRYGDAFGLDEVDALRLDMKSRGIPHDKIEQALQIWEDARDRVVGGFHGKNPLSWDNRAVRALKNLTNLSVMGKVLYSQVSDVAKVITTQGMGVGRLVNGQGPAGLIGGFMAAIAGDIHRFSPGGIAKQSGEALELVMARNLARQIESDDALIVTKQTGVERWLAAAQTPFFILNGMIPFTVILKEWTGVVSAHNLIEEARAVARTLQLADGEVPGANRLSMEPWLNGPRLSDSELEKTTARLALGGIDSIDAQLLAKMPTELGESGLHLPNVNAWEGAQGARARELLLAAVNGEIRRGVVTPGPLDRPAVFDGVFHSKKGREAALQKVAEARSLVAETKDAFAKVARRAEEDPERVAALDAYRAAQGELTLARRGVGRGGRIEAPIASLPFQMHSFAMASGAKTLHGLLGRTDRNKMGGILSLLAAGVYATWLKNERFDDMSWTELASEAVDRSGITAWLLDPIKATDSLFDLQLMPGNEYDPKGKSYADEVGTFGASLGVVTRAVEPFVSEGAQYDDRVAAVRRTLPFNNLMWLDGRIDWIEQHLKNGDDPNPPSAPYDPDEPVHEMQLREDTNAGLGRWGVKVPDLRQPPPEPPAPLPEPIPTMPPPPPRAPPAPKRHRRPTRPVLL